MKARMTLLLLLLASTAWAECDGYIRITEIPDKKVGDILSVLVYTTIDPSIGTRNIDVWIEDPKNNIFAIAKRQLDDGTWTVDGQVTVTDNWLNGRYTLFAGVEVYNTSNMEELVCEERETERFDVESNRTTYTDITLDLDIAREYDTHEVVFCKNATGEEHMSEVCISGRMPIGWNITIGDFIPQSVSENISNLSLLITPSTGFFSYNVMRHLHDNIAVLAGDAVKKDTFYENISMIFEEMGEGVQRVTQMLEEKETEIKSLGNDTSRLQNTVDSLEKTNTELRTKNDDMVSVGKLWINRVLSFVGGVILAVMLVVILANARSGETPDDD